jgi:RNA polymerase sigma-70 factor (ECF subfamily)
VKERVVRSPSFARNTMTQHSGQSRLRLMSGPAALPNDGALLARVASGDLGALGKLYDSYAPMLLRFVRRLGAAEDAEDVVQNVYLRVVRLSAQFDSSVPSARAWLFAIAVRVVQERRRSLRRLTHAMTAFATQKQSCPTMVESPAASDLVLCLSKLSLAKRMVLLLAEVEGFSCAEIAEMLDIPVGTVWTRLHHARRELRTTWGKTP